MLEIISGPRYLLSQNTSSGQISDLPLQNTRRVESIILMLAEMAQASASIGPEDMPVAVAIKAQPSA
jgi:hypothetical protein